MLHISFAYLPVGNWQPLGVLVRRQHIQVKGHMNNIKWSESEKKLSRSVYDAALKAELAEILAEFKLKAVSASTVEEMWDVEKYLAHQRREIDSKYDYRYSQLLFVFGRLIREGHLQVEQLNGLSPEKLDYLRRMLAP